jgi:hypothetical protein
LGLLVACGEAPAAVNRRSATDAGGSFDAATGTSHGHSAPNGVEPEHAVQMTDNGLPNPGGQTGSVTAPFCPAGNACDFNWAAEFGGRGELERIASASPSWTSVSSSCEPYSATGSFPGAALTVCRCAVDDADGGSTTVTIGSVRRSRVLGIDPYDLCEVYSTKGWCLIEPEEFDGCDQSAPSTSCVETCDLLVQRHNEIDTRPSDVRVLGAECSPCGGVCTGVLNIDGSCWSGEVRLHRYDCALSTRAILDEEFLPRTYVCDVDDDGGTGDFDGGR